MEFKKGHKYIVSLPYAKNQQISKGGVNNTEKGFVFVYERKEGRHHIFRESIGGWLRTYTDNQLIGKKITEVKS